VRLCEYLFFQVLERFIEWNVQNAIVLADTLPIPWRVWSETFNPISHILAYAWYAKKKKMRLKH